MEMRTHRIFLQNIKARRQELGWTQAQAAVAMKISQPSWAQIESGRSVPTLDVVDRVSKALKTSTQELLCEKSKIPA